jgi:hypothetical protein
MRLVITFSISGGWDCPSYDKVVPVEYESAEAFLVHFDDAMKAYSEASKKHSQDIEKWWKREPRTSGKPRYGSEKYAAWQASKPTPPGLLNIIDLNGFRFWASDLIEEYKDYTYTLPTVETLEEWFEKGIRHAKMEIT